MKEFENNAYFWQKVDALYSSGDFKVKHKKGSSHKHYPSLTYPCDYGYVESLSDESESSRDVFRSSGGGTVDSIAVCADIINKPFEVKAMVGLSEEELEEVLHFLNCTDYQKTVLIKRGKQIPSWGETE
ncbi:MAG: Inorganic pyrophosphatase [Erysipelotrichaceae bacterium]|nr:Inorganic pyrophosphatase [Erysipelotrichaceae bacterium]